MTVKLQAFDFPGIAIRLDSLTAPGEFVARTDLLIDKNSTDSLLRILINSPLPAGYTAYAELSGSFSYFNDKKSIADVTGFLTKQIFYISDGSIAYKVKSEEIIGTTFDVDYLGDENINSPLINYLYTLSLLSGNDVFIGSTGVVPNGQFDEEILGLAGNDFFSGNTGNDYFDGGIGIDTAIFRGALSTYTVTVSSSIFDKTDSINKKLLSGYLVTDKTINRDSTDTLTNVERLQFTDKNIALDLAPTQAAGQTALLLGAVLPGKLAFDASKQALLGNVISLFDQGFTLGQLSGAILRLPIWDVLTGKAAPTNADIAGYLVNNVYGGTQTAAITSAAIAAMNAETPATQGNYLASLAASAANQTHVDLVGVQATGLVYLG